MKVSKEDIGFDLVTLEMSAAETETDKSDSEEVLVNSLKAVSLKQAKEDSDDSDDDSNDSDDDSGESYGSNDDDSDQNSDDIDSVQSDKVQNNHQEQIWNGGVKDNRDKSETSWSMIFIDIFINIYLKLS